tara:strand:+ start:52 stop:663 length:612 start_codon:yes stop_codon:yes gene_type:complete
LSGTSRISVAVFAHKEEATIARCLTSLPDSVDGDALAITVIANGCTDATVQTVEKIAAKHANVQLTTLEVGDKPDAWNHFVHHGSLGTRACVFTDADVRITPGSLEYLLQTLERHHSLNAVTAVPKTGWSRHRWTAELKNNQTIAGGLYMLRPKFVQRLRSRQIRLPTAVSCDDAVIAMLTTNLGELGDLPGNTISPINAPAF